MANLQANLRSQCANLNEPITGLSAVNELFFDNTGDHAYATLFFGEYRGRSNRFRYANCGHLPGLLLRPDGVVERLAPPPPYWGFFGNGTASSRRLPSCLETCCSFTRMASRKRRMKPVTSLERNVSSKLCDGISLWARKPSLVHSLMRCVHLLRSNSKMTLR